MELESARTSLGPHTSPVWRAYYDYVAGEIRLETAPREAQPFLLRSLDTARRAGNHGMQAIAGLSALSCAARLGEPVDLGDFAELIDHWQRIGSWSQQWITVRTLVEMLTRLGRDEAAAVLHGALIGRETAPPIVGADAGRMAAAEATLRAASAANTSPASTPMEEHSPMRTPSPSHSRPSTRASGRRGPTPAPARSSGR